MTETNDQGDKTQGDKTGRGAARGGKTSTLTLNRTVDAGHVRQSFSHGRSKPVVVEKRKKRTIASPGGAAEESAVERVEETVAAAATATVSQPATGRTVTTTPPRKVTPPAAARNLSDDERDARVKALSAARAREADDRARAEEDAKRRALLDAQLKREQEELARARAEQERLKAKEALRQEEAGPGADTAPPKEVRAEPQRTPQRTQARTDTAKTVVNARTDIPLATEEQRRVAGQAAKRLERQEPEDEEGARKVGPGGVKKALPQRIPAKKTTDDRRARGRLTIVNALDDSQRVDDLSLIHI